MGLVKVEIDARIVWMAPEKIRQVPTGVHQMQWPQGGPEHQGWTPTRMIDAFMQFVKHQGHAPVPEVYVDAVQEMWKAEGLPFCTIRKHPGLERRLKYTYQSLMNGLYTASCCLDQGALEAYWSKLEDANGQADLRVQRADGISLTVAITTRKALEGSKARMRRNFLERGVAEPDLIILYDSDKQKRDAASNMSWIDASEIEKIFSFGCGDLPL